MTGYDYRCGNRLYDLAKRYQVVRCFPEKDKHTDVPWDTIVTKIFSIDYCANDPVGSVNRLTDLLLEFSKSKVLISAASKFL